MGMQKASPPNSAQARGKQRGLESLGG